MIDFVTFLMFTWYLNLTSCMSLYNIYSYHLCVFFVIIRLKSFNTLSSKVLLFSMIVYRWTDFFRKMYTFVFFVEKLNYVLPRWSSGLRRADIWLIQWTIIWRRGFDSRRRQVPRRKTVAFN